MGTCCGKIEKNPAENKSFPEASDEAKPLRPMRDAEVRRRKINKEATPSENTEEIQKTVDSTKALNEGNKPETKTSSLNNLETEEDDTSKIEQVSKSIQNVDLGEIKDALRNGTNDAASSPTEPKSCTETKLTPIVPESEATFRNTISEEQPDQPKENCTNSTGKTDESEHISSSSVQSFEEKTGSSEADHVLQETVFPLDLSSGEKEKLEGEGINVEAITQDFDRAKEGDKETSQATFEQVSELTTHTESDLKALLTPDLLKTLNEENNINNSGDLQDQKNEESTKEKEQAEKPDEAVAIFPPSLSSAENANEDVAATELLEDFDRADKVVTSIEKNSERKTHSLKIESDLGALLTPNLLRKLHEEQQSKERSDETQTAQSKEALVGSTTEASGLENRPASSSAIRLSQQEQRQSRNSFLGNFLQEGVFSSFDEQFNSMTSEDPAKKIEAIAKSTGNLQRQVETFSGGKTSTEYLYLESSLLINIDELNKIESSDDGTKKADALSHIYELLKKLDENSVF